MIDLNNDELGELGESRFGGLCASAKLICNKSSRDRAGWDFVVDFGLPDSILSFDTRRAPLSCHVQVKTITEKAKGIRMRLSMAERFAKELKPCFIYVFRVDAEHNFKEAYLIHVYGSRLATILKRLRKESSKSKDAKINNMEISFTPTEEEKIDISGRALKFAIESTCGFDLARYSMAKQRLLGELGYSDTPLKMTATFDQESVSALQDAFLGFGNDITVEDVSIIESRFDIPLPLNIPQQGTLTIEPSAPERWRIVFRAPGLPPVICDGLAYIAPQNLSRGQLRMRIVTEFTEFNFRATEDNTTLNIKTFSSKGRKTIDAWRKYFGIIQTIHLGGTFEIEPPSKKPWPLPIPENYREQAQDVSDQIRLCDAFRAVLAYAGSDFANTFEWRAVMAADKDVRLLHSFITGGSTALTFEGLPSQQIVENTLPRTPLASQLHVGDFRIAYYVVADIDMRTADKNVVVHMSNVLLREVRMMSHGQDLRSYIEQIQHAEGTVSVGCFNTTTLTEIEADERFRG